MQLVRLYISSIFISQDQVALESVCYDFLRTEWNGTYSHDPSNNFFEAMPYINGVDDYLHQAASPEWWPDGITYDPDNSGTPIGSLGVHEHWNNTTDMKYTRDLGTGEGIELIKIFTGATLAGETQSDYSFDVFPNPVTENARIRFSLAHGGQVRLELFSLDGKRIQTLLNGRVNAGDQSVDWHPDVPQGIYIIKLSIKGNAVPEEYLKKIEVL